MWRYSETLQSTSGKWHWQTCISSRLLWTGLVSLWLTPTLLTLCWATTSLYHSLSVCLTSWHSFCDDHVPSFRTALQFPVQYLITFKWYSCSSCVWIIFSLHSCPCSISLSHFIHFTQNGVKLTLQCPCVRCEVVFTLCTPKVPLWRGPCSPHILHWIKYTTIDDLNETY